MTKVYVNGEQVAKEELKDIELLQEKIKKIFSDKLKKKKGR